MFALQTNPASPAVLNLVLHKIFMYLILGMFTIAPSSFPGLPSLLRHWVKPDFVTLSCWSSRLGWVVDQSNYTSYLRLIMQNTRCLPPTAKLRCGWGLQGGR
jgi:hypothetical protein